MIARRELRFASLADAVADMHQLHTQGYERAGNWDLAQVCKHLTEWVRYPMDGFPRLPLLLRPVFWGVRQTLARKMLRDLLAPNGTMSIGSSTAPQSVFPAGLDPAEAVANYTAMVDRFTAFTGPLLPSPLFGTMTREQLTALHSVHAAHHLSFLVPAAQIPSND